MLTVSLIVRNCVLQASSHVHLLLPSDHVEVVRAEAPLRQLDVDGGGPADVVQAVAHHDVLALDEVLVLDLIKDEESGVENYNTCCKGAQMAY